MILVMIFDEHMQHLDQQKQTNKKSKNHVFKQVLDLDDSATKMIPWISKIE